MINYPFFFFAIIFCIGLFIVISSSNLVKKLMGLAIFQTSVLLFYIAIADSPTRIAPIFREGLTHGDYTNPLPHVLMLTAIVVGVALTAVGSALVVRIKERFDSSDEEQIIRMANLDLKYEAELPQEDKKK